MRLFAEVDLEYKPPQPELPQSPAATASGSILCHPRLYTGCCIPEQVMGPLSTLQVSYLSIVEAKMQSRIMLARRQLLAYVGCLHYGRRNADKQVDCTSYGVASDACTWIFRQITYDETVRFTEARDIRAIGWEPILRTVIRILEHATYVQATISLSRNRPGWKVSSRMIESGYRKARY